MTRVFFFLVPFLIAVTAYADDNWNQFRGPTGRGHSPAENVPTEWSADSVKWRVELKGVGQSSPVNWGDKLFLTGASEDGKKRYVFCLDRKTGETLWEKTIPCAAPEQHHKMNSWATPSCATDGERVIAFFGAGGVHAFDLDGKELWSHKLGGFPGSWGVAASPVLAGEKVIVNTDCTGPSALIAYDIASGKELWKTEREAKPRGGWSTPILIEHGGKKEIVLNGEFGVRGYDLESGKELWFCRAFNGRGTPVPEYAGETIYAVSGKPGDCYAITPGGSGDVTDSHMKWHSERPKGRDLPSPAVVGDYLFISNMAGVATCYDRNTGETFWTERTGLQGEVAAAPLVANGLVYFQATFGGDIVVIKPGKELEVIAMNSIGAKPDEIFRATLAPIQGQLFARSQSALYCVGN